jgi:hypothetical protein
MPSMLAGKLPGAEVVLRDDPGAGIVSESCLAAR